MSEADYVSLRAVARERGESQAELAGLLADRGYDLWLWFDGSGQRDGVLVFPEHPLRRDEYAIGPGAYPLTQGSREMLIKRLQRGDTRTEGLEMLIEMDDTLGGVVTWRVRLMEQDDSVCVVVNPADLDQMPPPSEDMDASGSGHPTMRGEKILKIFLRRVLDAQARSPFLLMSKSTMECRSGKKHGVLFENGQTQKTQNPKR